MDFADKLDFMDDDCDIEGFPLAGEQVCRVCGCTDSRACPGGCYWVEDNLCSACAEKLDQRLTIRNETGAAALLLDNPCNDAEAEQT